MGIQGLKIVSVCYCAKGSSDLLATYIEVVSHNRHSVWVSKLPLQVEVLLRSLAPRLSWGTHVKLQPQKWPCKVVL